MPINTWTNEELHILQKLYATTPANVLSREFLPGRSERSITTKAFRLGLKQPKTIRPPSQNKPWTADELTLLDREYEEHGAIWLHANGLENRTLSAIMAMADKRKLRTKSPAWTDHEDDILKANYSTMSTKELTRLLPGRSQKAIVFRARDLGLTSGITNTDTIKCASAANGHLHGTNIGFHTTHHPFRSNKTTGIRGVCYDKHSKKFIAHICFLGRRQTLGYYGNIEDAVAARKAAEEAIRPELDRIKVESASMAADMIKQICSDLKSKAPRNGEGDAAQEIKADPGNEPEQKVVPPDFRGNCPQSMEKALPCLPEGTGKPGREE